MKLTEEEMESAIGILTDEVSDFLHERVCDVMLDSLIHPLGDNNLLELDVEQIDKIVTNVCKNFYSEKEKTKQ